ncbi:MAG TPA: hypothetical protein VN442_16480 [Bryobacteraceae bacterium]|nr:hypothetical protein [Bryobacteraceae bacterium]
MQSQVAPSVQGPRLDGRSLIAAGLCVLALFFDLLGWVLAIAGIVLLRRAVLSRTAKWLLATIAISPKLLFIGVRSLNAPEGLSFPIEPRNLATSSSLWAWCIFLVAFGVYLIFVPQQLGRATAAPVQPRPRRSLLIAAMGLVPIAVGVVVLLGLTDGFHRIDDAGQGQWALRHAARGNVAIFSGSDLVSIDATERYGSRSGRDYSVRVALADGRSFSVTTKSAAALEELRKFATTANLPRDKVRIIRRHGGRWTNGASGFTLKDCVGTYEHVDESSRSRKTFEFWLDGERLTGKETVADPVGRHVRVLRNIKVSESGDVEFQPATYVEASQQDKRTVSLSFGWSPQGETGRFVRNGFEVGLQKYRKQ